MQLHHHALVSPILFILLPFIGLYGVIVAIASSLISDFDHIHLIIMERAFTPEKLKHLNQHIYDKGPKGEPNRAFIDIIYLFHTIEFNLLLLVLSLKFHWLIFVVIGFVFHIIVDIIHHRKHGLPIIRWLFLTDYIIFILKNHKKQKI